MSQFKRILSASAVALVATAAILASTPAHAQTQTQSSACRTVTVTGSRVAIREFAFTDSTIVRTVPRGTVLYICGPTFLGGTASEYIKCGRVSANWLPLTMAGRPVGLTVQDRNGVLRTASAWFPAACAK